MEHNEFPIFVPDQLLSPDNLNDLFEYLDEQEHYTRTCLIGVGIACGMHLTTAFSGASITISKGCGVTSFGYLVHFPGAVYTKYLPFVANKPRKYAPFVTGETQNFDLYELKVDAAPDPGMLPLTDDFISDKVVLIFVEVLESHAKNCDPNSCDDKGINVSITFRPLLVSEDNAAALKAGAGGLKPIFDTATLKLPTMSMRRVDVPATGLLDTAAVFEAFLEPLTKEFFAALQTALNTSHTALLSVVGDLYPSNPFAGLDSKYGFLATRKPTEAQLLHTQYYYDLFSDILSSYEELRCLAAQVTGICCPNDEFPRHLLLGKAKGYSQYTPTEFRHYFTQSPALRSEVSLLSDLRSLFVRLVQLINGFSVPAAQTSGGKLIPEFVRVTPSAFGQFPLSHKAIPYYFSITSAFLEHWDRAKTKRGAADQNLSYHSPLYGKTESVQNPLLYDLEPYNFLRVEGHIGQPYKTSVTSVQLQKKQNRLPIDVIALSSDAASLFAKVTAAQKEGDITRSSCHFDDLESLYQALEKHLICFLCKEMKYYYGISNTRTAPGEATLTPTVSLLKKCDPSFRYAQGTVGEDFEKWYPTIGKAVYTPAAQTISMSGYGAYLTVYQHLVLAEEPEETEAPIIITDKASKPAAVTFDTGKEKIAVDEKFLARRVAVNAAITDAYIAMANQFMRSVLYYIQRIYESLNGSLVTLNIEMLAERFDDLQEIARVNKEALAKKANDVPTLKTEELLDHLDRIIYSCDLSEFRSLAVEFERRWRSIDALRRLAYYAKKCPGLQHKAGVPMGGTFILVYHEPTPADLEVIDIKEIEAKNTDKFLKEIWTDLEKKKKPSKLQDLIEDIPSGTVIADFYLPFICCSDCPPIHFEVVAPDQPEVIAQLSISPAEFCSDTAGPIPITVWPPGGEIEGEGTDTNGTSGFVFYPNKVPLRKALWREVQLKYEAEGASASATVKVFHKPTAKIKFTKGPKLGSGHIEVDGVDSTFVAQYFWTFGDKTPEVNHQKASHDYAQSGDYDVTLTVTNGKCSDYIVQRINIRLEPPTIALEDSELCNDLQNPVAVIVSPPGGKLSIDGVESAVLLFHPGKVILGQRASKDITLTYTVQGVKVSTTATVFHPPVAKFKIEGPLRGSRRIKVDADDSSFVSKYLWDLGDGASATKREATHDYKESKLYTITLTVFNGPCSAKTSRDISFEPNPPICITRESLIEAFSNLQKLDAANFNVFVQAVGSFEDISSLIKEISPSTLTIVSELAIYRTRKAISLLIRSLDELTRLIEIRENLRTLAIELFRILTNWTMRIACIQGTDINAGLVPAPALNRVATRTADLAKIFPNLSDTQKPQVELLLRDIQGEQSRMAPTTKTDYKTSLEGIIGNLESLNF